MATEPHSLLAELPLFVLLVDQKSFTNAARMLGLPKSTVSRRLSRLEERLGVQLLIRTTRQMRLTPAGEELLRHARQLLATVESIEEGLRQEQNSMRGVLRLSGPPILSELWLAPAVTRFLAEHHEVEVALDVEARFVDLVAERYDVAVRVGHLSDSSIMARKIGVDGLRVVASQDYLDRKGTPLKPDDLAAHNCMRYGIRGEAPRPWSFAHEGKSRTVDTRGTLVTNSFAALLDAAQAGLGIACVPNLLCREALQKGTLVSLLEPWLPEAPGIHLVYPSGRHVPRLTRAFLDFLIDDASRSGLAV